MNKRKLHPMAALVICAILWSSGGFLIKSVDWNPLAITGSRSFIAALFISLVLRRKPIFCVRNVSAGKVDFSATVDLWIGAVCYAATMLLFVVATKMTIAANAIFLQYTNPIWIVLFGPALLGEKKRKSDYLAILGVFAGMLLFFSGGLGGGSFVGNILAVLAGVAMGFMSIFMRRQKNANPVDSFVLSHIITFAVALPFFFTQPPGNPQVGSACLLALGVIQIGIPSILYSIGITGESALTSVLISMIEPIMNPVWVFLFIHEVPSTGTIIGGAIILGSIVLRAYVQNRIPAKK